MLEKKKIVSEKTLTMQDKLRFKISPKVFLFSLIKLQIYLVFNTIQLWSDGSYNCAQNSIGLVNDFVSSLSCLSECNAVDCDVISGFGIDQFISGSSSFSWNGNADFYRFIVRKEDSNINLLDSIIGLKGIDWDGTLDNCQNYVISVSSFCNSIEGESLTLIKATNTETQIQLLDLYTFNCDISKNTYSLKAMISHNGGNNMGIDINIKDSLYHIDFQNSPQSIILDNLPSFGDDDAFIRFSATELGGPYCDSSTEFDIPNTDCDFSRKYTFDDCQIPSDWSVVSSNNRPFSDPYTWKVANRTRLINNYADGPNKVSLLTIDGSCMFYFDDDISSDPVYSGTIVLTTNKMDMSEYVEGFISYDYIFHSFEEGKGVLNDSYFKVETYDGDNWRTVTYIDTSSCLWFDVWGEACIQVDRINISEYTNSDFQVRFTYSDGGDGSWAGFVALDNYKIKAQRKSTVLPLNLISLNAKSYTGFIEVIWKTEQEYNLDYFEIERSKNGLEFETLDKVRALNRSNQEYVYMDNHPFEDINYYRLKMKDMDGSFIYSNTINEVFAVNQDEIRFSYFPNPVLDNYLDIKSNRYVEKVFIRILDTQGRVVENISSENLTTNDFIRIKFNDLKSGLYLVEINTGIHKYHKKIYKL